VGAVVGLLDVLVAVQAHVGLGLAVDVPHDQLLADVRAERLRKEPGGKTVTWMVR
jgi:hypothetical protein